MRYYVIMMDEDGCVIGRRWFEDAIEAHTFGRYCPLETIVYAVKEEETDG